MTTPRKKITRRAALAGLAAAPLLGAGDVRAQAAQPKERPLAETVPIQGKAGPGLEPFDEAMLKIMNHHGVPGAALAIAKGGKLVLAKGYGWANVPTGDLVEPDTPFGLGSLSKLFTAVAALQLVERGKLGLDDSVFDILKHIEPPRGARVDPRLRDVTVRCCLNHSGGWDRAVNGDPINWEPQICRAFRLRPPLSPTQFLSFVLSLPLDFKPATDAKYSNIGYVILGEVITKVSGQPYLRFVTENVLTPLGIKDAGIHAYDNKYLPREARRHLAGTLLTLPPMQLPMVDSAGGWSASAVDMLRFLTNMDGSRGKPILGEKMRQEMLAAPPEPIKPRADGSHFGLGWDFVYTKDKEIGYTKDGCYQGIRTFMKRKETGVSWALLYNASMEMDALDVQIATSTVHEIREFVERFDKYPDVDLFKEYP
jgi:N-acyl-D-amino-acid deacylase